MLTLKIEGIPTDTVVALQSGALDAYAKVPEVYIAQGLANPCRHCLQLIEEGENKLVLAYSPFDVKQAYAETGPIFLHEKACKQYCSDTLPDWFAFLDPAIIRGYDDKDRIMYETGAVVSALDIEKQCMNILANAAVQYVHIRSKYNCFQCKVERS